MDINKEREGNRLTVTLAGELNTVTSPGLKEALKDEVKADDTVIFDMTELVYITSAGLRILVACDVETGEHGAVILRGVNDGIRDILEVTGLNAVFRVE
jgi:anti-sigma B factor antagonist